MAADSITAENLSRAIDFCTRYNVFPLPIHLTGYSVGDPHKGEFERVDCLLAFALYKTGVLDKKKGYLDTNQLSWLVKELNRLYGEDYISGFMLGYKERGTGNRKRTEELIRGYKDGRSCIRDIRVASASAIQVAGEKLSKHNARVSASRGSRGGWRTTSRIT